MSWVYYFHSLQGFTRWRTWMAEDGVAVAWVHVRSGHHVRALPVVFTGGKLEWDFYRFITSPRTMGLSASALKHRAAAVRLLFSYYGALGRPSLSGDGAGDLYEPLAEALLKGTVADGRDPLGLHWQPRTVPDTRILLGAMRAFLDFLIDDQGLLTRGPKAALQNCQMAAGYRHHLELQKANSVFSHLKNTSGSLQERRLPKSYPFPCRGSGGRLHKSVPMPFPEKHVTEFFAVGLRRRKVAERTGDPITDNYNVRDFLYFLLLMFGGLRGAEPLHLFIEDVQPDRECGQGTSVFLWHPANGPSPDGAPSQQEGRRLATRREYLARRYGRTPRNEMNGHPQHAGWKNLLLEEQVPRLGQRSRVYWQNPAVGHLFWTLHALYINQIRPHISAHPYYFVSLERSAFGSPWTEASAQDAFRSAMRRMGLDPGSARGLCRHGMRHRLAHWLVKAGVPPQHIQIILHQQSISSQEKYSRLQAEDVTEALTRAHDKRERGITDFDADDLGISWRSDPLKMFSGPTKRLLKQVLKVKSGGSET